MLGAGVKFRGLLRQQLGVAESVKTDLPPVKAKATASQALYKWTQAKALAVMSLVLQINSGGTNYGTRYRNE